jgi:hypothetical protein
MFAKYVMVLHALLKVAVSQGPTGQQRDGQDGKCEYSAHLGQEAQEYLK